MVYIKVRKQSDGSIRYTAIVRLRSGKTIVHQEARTFAHRVAAVTWAKHREVALEDPSALTRVRPAETLSCNSVQFAPILHIVFSGCASFLRNIEIDPLRLKLECPNRDIGSSKVRLAQFSG
jgi:hypothetical protein